MKKAFPSYRCRVCGKESMFRKVIVDCARAHLAEKVLKERYKENETNKTLS